MEEVVEEVCACSSLFSLLALYLIVETVVEVSSVTFVIIPVFSGKVEKMVKIEMNKMTEAKVNKPLEIFNENKRTPTY